MAEIPTILVTGAGGFIGGRVVEVLHASGQAAVVAAIRRWASAVRIARQPIEIRLCDVSDARQVGESMRGVTHVVHCATGGPGVDVAGTNHVLEAAERLGIQRVVYLSTVAVFGDTPGAITEDTAVRPGASAYGDAKLEAERLCRSYSKRGVPVTILRPTIVYGPFSESWVVEFVTRMRRGRWMLPARDCGGRCNLVYVDDLVAAIDLALHHPEAAHETFIVNGPDHVTWHDYFIALNKAAGLAPLDLRGRMSSRAVAAAMMPVRKGAKLLLRHFGSPILALYKRNALARRLMRSAEGAIRQTPTTNEFQLYGRQVHFSADKARTLLGYEPAVTLDAGLALVGAWLRHHRYC